MKRADIKPGTDYAVSVKLRKYDKTNAIARATVLDFQDNKVVLSLIDEDDVRVIAPAQVKSIRVIAPAQVKSTWADHEADLAAKQAKRDKEREKQSAAWEAKRAEERERFEQHILPAFHGLPTVGYVGHGREDPDLAEYIRYFMLDGGSSTVTLREADLRGIADRIAELQAIVQQNAMIAGDPPEAGWAPVLQQPLVAERIEEAIEEEAQTGREPIIEIPLSALGLDVADGD